MVRIKSVVKVVFICLITGGFILSSVVGRSQSVITKIGFSSVNEIGLVAGDAGEAFTAQTINGIKKGRSFAGVGVGFDFYELRSIPLFLDYRIDLTKRKNTPFAYASGGLNFLWLNFIQKEQIGSPSSSPGSFYDLGAGWKLSGKNNGGFIISAGYSLKQVKYRLPSYSVSPTPQMQSENFDRYNFLYRRVVIKIGLQL
jgi:hypothetical protein